MKTTAANKMETAIRALPHGKPCSAPAPKPTPTPKSLTQRLASHSEWATKWRRRHLDFDEPTRGHERVAKMVQLFALRVAADQSEGQPTLMVLHGPPGPGKSHLARKAHRFLSHGAIAFWHDMKTWGRPPQCVFVAWPDLVAKESDDVWQMVKDADLVVVDEVGGEVDRFRSGASVEKIRAFLEMREDRWTLITTNFAPELWESAWDSRVASRLKKAIHVSFQGIPDYRSALTVVG